MIDIYVEFEPKECGCGLSQSQANGKVNQFGFWYECAACNSTHIILPEKIRRVCEADTKAGK